MRPRSLACALALTAIAGCTTPNWGDAYLHALAAGTRAYHAGRFLEAARAYHDAANKALRVRDRDEALFQEARMFERTEQWQEALAAYRALAAASPTGERTERVRFVIAETEIDHGNASAGWPQLEATLLAHPNSGNAHAALARILSRVAEQGGDAAVVTWLAAHEKSLARTDLGQTVTYERAKALERLGRLDEARDAYLDAARSHPYPHGSLTDDAFWNAADLEARQGRYAQAIALLEEMLAPRETSGEPGSYERPRFPAAQQRIAELYRDRLKDHHGARLAFHKLYEEHKATILRDDALWNEARLAREDGDGKSACEVMELLAKKFPDSRYALCTRELCPSAPAPNKACAGYIVRQLERPAGSPEPNDDAE